MELNPAQQLMAKGYHCTEAVLLAVCQQLGIEDKLIPRIAAGFAGGMGRTGGVCGAVVGAIMCIGVKHGREDPGQWEQDELANGLTQGFLKDFRDEMGAIECRELIGFDPSTPEGLAAFRKSDVPVRVCLRAVGFAYDKTLELLQAQDVESPLNVGCYSGGRYGERPQWVEREGRRLAVARINRQHREEDRLVFDVTLEDKQRLILYYYPQRGVWLGVKKE